MANWSSRWPQTWPGRSGKTQFQSSRTESVPSCACRQSWQCRRGRCHGRARLARALTSPSKAATLARKAASTSAASFWEAAYLERMSSSCTTCADSSCDMMTGTGAGACLCSCICRANSAGQDVGGQGPGRSSNQRHSSAGQAGHQYQSHSSG